MKRIITFCVILTALVVLLVIPASAAPTSATEIKINGTQNYDEVNVILDLVNKERAEIGLDPLVLDPKLTEYAMQRAAEIAVYYSHSRPNGSDCFTIMDKKFQYYGAGENIAAGHLSGKAVMGDDDDPSSGGWMNSSGHRANILRDYFTSIGIGCFYQEDGTKFWVQMFSGTTSAGGKTQTGIKNVKNIPISVSQANLKIYLENVNESGEAGLYAGTTIPLNIRLQNAGWEYASPVILSGGYKVTSSDTKYLTVNTSGTSMTGVKSGSAKLKVTFDGGNSTQANITIWNTPTLSYAINDSGHTVVTWTDEGGQASLLRRRESSSSWSLAAYPVQGTSSYTNYYAQSTEAYTYVLAIDVDGKTVLLTDQVTAWPQQIPVINKVENINGNITVSWSPVEGADRYRVYVKTTGDWQEVKDTNSTSIIYTDAGQGSTYSFSVRCINYTGTRFTSDFDPVGKSIVLQNLSTPQITQVTNTASGVKVTWGAVEGAAKYRLYVKTSGGNWTKVGDTTNTSLTYTKAASGTKYSFTVRCVTADSKSLTSDYNKTGKSITYIAQPKISEVTNTTSGVKVTWDAVKGAANYRLYVKTSGGSWTKVGDTTGTSMTYTKAASGTKYTFTVRCITADSKTHTSSYDATGKSITYIAAPKVSAVSNTTSGVKVTWDAVKGAAKYRLYVKTSGGSWTKVGETTDTSLTYTGAASGTKYTFTVRCITADSKSFTSSYDTTGKSITYIAAPKVSAVSNTASGVKVTWDAVKGAAKYRLYVKTSGGSWTKVGETTDTSLTYTGAASGTKYTFTVRCITADSKSFTSSYDTTGKSITYIAQPKVTKLQNTADGIKLTWNTVPGAAKYRVFVKTSSGWKKVADTTDTSFLFTGGEAGQTYTFTVRVTNAAGTSYTSSYHASGWSILRK